MTIRSLSLALSLLVSPLLLAPPAQARFSQEEMEVMIYLQENEPLSLEQLKDAVAKGLDPKAPLQNKVTHLHWAAVSGDDASIRYLLELGCDIEARDALGNTPLVYAATRQGLDVVKLLLEQGADAKVLGQNKQPLVFFACKNRHAEVLRFLLDSGHKLSDVKPSFYYSDAFELACDCRNLNVALYLAELGEVKDKDAALFRCVNHQSEHMLPLMEWLLDHGASANAKHAKSGETILHDACDAQCPKLAELLIARGADINAQDDFGSTPLSSCCSGNNMVGTLLNPCVELLLKHGAKTEILDKNGYTALGTASLNGRMEAVRLLLEHGAHPEGGVAENRAIKNAVYHGRLEIFNLLVVKGAKYDDAQLLHLALYHQRFLVATRLLELGLDINAVDRHGVTALIAAATMGRQAEVAFLIARGADIKMSDKSGATALSTAKRYGYPSIVKLLEAAAQPRMTDEEQAKAVPYLIQEVSDGHLDSVQELLVRGMDITKPYDGATMLQYACFEGSDDMAAFLIALGCDVNYQGKRIAAEGCEGETALMLACRGNFEERVKLLLAHGAKLELRDSAGWTALFHVVGGEKKDAIISLLLMQGADVNASSPMGWTPLMEAAYRGSASHVQQLLQAGADANAQTTAGDTALRWACHYGDVDKIKLLIAHGADVHHQNKKGESALDYATHRGTTAAMEYLKGINQL